MFSLLLITYSIFYLNFLTLSAGERPEGCKVTLWTGSNSDGDRYGSFNYGMYYSNKDFPRDKINSITLQAYNGYDCGVTIYKNYNPNSWEHTYRFYLGESGTIRKINAESKVDGINEAHFDSVWGIAKYGATKYHSSISEIKIDSTEKDLSSYDCIVYLYEGNNFNGKKYGPFNVGFLSYSDYFSNDKIKSFEMTAQNGNICAIELYDCANALTTSCDYSLWIAAGKTIKRNPNDYVGTGTKIWSQTSSRVSSVNIIKY